MSMRKDSQPPCSRGARRDVCAGPRLATTSAFVEPGQLHLWPWLERPGSRSVASFSAWSKEQCLEPVDRLGEGLPSRVIKQRSPSRSTRQRGWEGTPMLTVVDVDGMTSNGALIDEIVREGARRMLAAALEAEVDTYRVSPGSLARGECTPPGRARARRCEIRARNAGRTGRAVAV